MEQPVYRIQTTIPNIQRTSFDVKDIRPILSCPINSNVPTKMTLSGFRTTCEAFQKKHNRKSRMNLNGFISRRTHLCEDCSIGKRVKNGWNVQKLPPNIEIFDFDEFKPDPIGCRKLNRKGVMKIRSLYESGATIKELTLKFPKVKRSTIADVVHRRTWKHL